MPNIEKLNQQYPDIIFSQDGPYVIGICSETLETVVYAFIKSNTETSVSLADSCGTPAFRDQLVQDIKN